VIRVEFFNKIRPRARLTIITETASVCVIAPIRPWLRLSGRWFVHSRKKIRETCESNGVIVPTDDEIRTAIEEAWNALV